MAKRILVIGGAGFIGSFLVDTLISQKYQVRVLDNLTPQVHGSSKTPPPYFNPQAEFIHGDICNKEDLTCALKDVDAVFYFAAAVGVGQSMYEISRYVSVNSLGAAQTLEVISANSQIQKMIVASSMSIYGEGKYSCESCGEVYPKLREEPQLLRRQWEIKCPYCEKVVMPLPTDEEKPLFPTSIYAITKRDQEEMFMCIGRAYSIPTVALRYFNVYGPRQSLSNPYTGVAAIFSSRIKNGNPPLIFEDGQQSRDFVHVSDIVQACLLALEKEEANYQVLNVGTGQPITILDLANILCDALDAEIVPKITYKYRAGDIRHCYADISKAQRILGVQPRISLKEGISDLVDWARTQSALDLSDNAQQELEQRRLAQ